MTTFSAETTAREPVPTGLIVRIDVGPNLNLAQMVSVDAAVRSAMRTDPIRIVIDARNLQSMTLGAHLALVGATLRLQRAGIELVVERCPPWARHLDFSPPLAQSRSHAS
jgi:hypothetical protein